jgi:hypothetical protein
MKSGKVLASIVLWLAVFGMGFWLYRIIQGPVEFEKQYDERLSTTVDRLQDIKKAQGFYLLNNDQYANDFDKLINLIKFDSLMIIKTIGDPDDTSVVTTFDTLRIALIDTVKFKGTKNIEDLKYVPFSDNELFELESDIITLQRVKVPVYQVVATRAKYLKGLDAEEVSKKKDLILGSLTQASEQGNWE